MTSIAAIGGNNPPDPLDEALAPYGDFIAEAENWLDGTTVETEAQMQAVDAIAKQIKAALKAVEAADESETKPIYDTWKTAKARYKPTLDDLDRIKRGLAAIGNDFKKKLAAQKAEAERKARAEAEAARRAAEEKARAASATDIEAQREAMAAQEEARRKQAEAAAASKDTVKGLRTAWQYEITDYRALLHWIARNDQDALTAFIEEWARKNHKNSNADGLRAWQEKEAF